VKRDSTLAIFHGGTRCKGNMYYTSSGRVLTLATSGSSVAEARKRAYAAAQQISFEGMHYRKDIGLEAGTAAAS